MKSVSGRINAAVLVMLLVSGLIVSSKAAPSLSDPLVDFDSILFIARGCRPSEPHLCDQFFGCFATPGGSIYIVSGFKNNQRKVTDILANATPKNGRYMGKKLTGGSFVSPDLSYDGKTVLFAWKPGSTAYQRSWDIDQCFHIFKVNIDGTNLEQLTDGQYNDFDPCWLPSGRIVFNSERRGGYGRCHGRKVPTYCLTSMKADGSDITILSYHETNEWNPSVDNKGMILYSRWDYVDRDDCIAHHPWICFPDGRDPRAWHGNYPVSLSTMEEVMNLNIPGVGKGSDGKWPDGRFLRPEAEVNVRAIPNSSKWVAIGTGHHTESFGEIIVIDPDIKDDGKMSQITGITTKKTVWSDATAPWATPWPLSEKLFMASRNGDIVLVDEKGEYTPVCPKSATPVSGLSDSKLLDPIPVKARPVPPNLAVQTYDGEREKIPHQCATLSVANVYNSDLPFPANTKIKWLRIVQLTPKSTPNINEPRVGDASESTCRLSLGVVPVESDGSAYFQAPVGKAIYFQVLDSNFRAVQSMRSLTYVHKGEHLSCAGCHEDKWKATPPGNPMALKRNPTLLKPELPEAIPVSYHRTVRSIFESKCKSCHTTERKGPDMSYSSLMPYVFHFCDRGWPYLNGNLPTGEIGGSRTIPGHFGTYAKKSTLYSHLFPSHHNVNLTKDEIHRVVIWMDCNANELGSEANESGQKANPPQVVYPTIDVDKNNLVGVEPWIPDTDIVANKITAAPIKSVPYSISSTVGKLSIDGVSTNAHCVEVFTMRGQRLASERGRGNLHFSMTKQQFGSGMFIVRLTLDSGVFSETVSLAGR